MLHSEQENTPFSTSVCSSQKMGKKTQIPVQSSFFFFFQQQTSQLIMMNGVYFPSQNLEGLHACKCCMFISCIFYIILFLIYYLIELCSGSMPEFHCIHQYNDIKEILYILFYYTHLTIQSLPSEFLDQLKEICQSLGRDKNLHEDRSQGTWLVTTDLK